MRVNIREQLALLVLLTSLLALAVVSIASWYNNYHLVVNLRASRLSLTASLKAAQLSSNLLLLESSVRSLATNLIIQSALQRYNDNGNNTASNWIRARENVRPTLGAGGRGNLLFQAMVLPKNSSGSAGRYSLLNVTGDFPTSGKVRLPYIYPNGTSVILGDDGPGYPVEYYPNITYTIIAVNGSYISSTASVDTSFALGNDSAILLGPFQINQTFALVSLTVPIKNNSANDDVLGYMSVLASACSIYEVLSSPVGTDHTGLALLVGPTSLDNHFPSSDLAGRKTIFATNGTAVRDLDVKFVLAPPQNESRGIRHALRTPMTSNPPFVFRDYPVLEDALLKDNQNVNNAGSLISTKNEEGHGVSVGYAVPQTSLADWVLLLEESNAEVFAPIQRLRKVLLACVFGAAGLIIILVFPIAHLSVRPIRRLREATKKSVEPPGYGSDHSSAPSHASGTLDLERRREVGHEEPFGEKRRLSFVRRLLLPFSRSRRKGRSARAGAGHNRTFRIPGKVQDRTHLFQDELSDLTQTYNAMSDELLMQYERLEQRVAERTQELELSRKAAEAANESKTLFIANISHELKTPLNGILGMTAVSMQEDDLPRIKRSLGIIYKSGDLLLHLLTDLLTFSKNQIGQQLSLEEREFRLCDVSSQILSIFDKQAREGKIDLRVVYCGVDGPLGDQGYGPPGTGRVQDMFLWGDQNRILQVIINLVSNSLKFTPEGKSVELRLRCLGEADLGTNGSLHRSNSSGNRQGSSNQPGASSAGSSSGTPGTTGPIGPVSPLDTALAINARPSPSKYPRLPTLERSCTPAAPKHAKTLLFEFEVEDSGPGIPLQLQERVFEPFVQGDVGLSKNYGGTGLGLSICSQLAKLMSGSIRLHSVEGKGSTFTVRIPLKFTKERADSMSSSILRHLESSPSSLDDPVAESIRHREACGRVHPAAPPAGSTAIISSALLPTADGPTPRGASDGAPDPGSTPRLVGLSAPFFVPSPATSTVDLGVAALEHAVVEASKTGDRVRVLVAEDNKVNQEVVLRMLKLEDIYDVSVAKDGQEAYEMVKQSMTDGQRFDLIFMDVQMPNLDGLQSTRMIRDLGYSAPIVALTAFAEESNVKECMACGMNFFLAKPIRRPALKQVLMTYCATIPEEDQATPLERPTDPLTEKKTLP